MSYRPACYDSDLDYDCEELYGMQNNPTKKKKVVKKTPEELLRENLVMIVNERDCAKLKKTLNENPKFDLDQPVFLEWPLLFFACHMAYTDIVRYLIEERKRDINLDVESETPLSVACYSNGVSKEVLQTVELLISKGSVVNVSNSSGVTPLMFASMKDHLVVVEYLLQKKAAIQAIDNDGRTALHCAVEYNRLDIAKHLIDAGIDTTVRNRNGYSAKLLAQVNNRSGFDILFPPEDKNFLVPIIYKYYDTFEDLVPGIQGEPGIPHYFPDVVRMLEGMNCNRFIDKFSEAKVSLEEFLTISDIRLKEIGILFPYQRKMIQQGLYEFHKKDWSKMSNPLFDDDVENCITTQYYHLLATLFRQLIVLKSTCSYLKESRFISRELFQDKFDQPLLTEHYKNLSVIRKEFQKIIDRSVKEAAHHPTYIGNECICPLWIDYSGEYIRKLNNVFCLSLPLVITYCGFKIFKTLKY